MRTLKALSLSLFALPMLVACGQAEDAVDENQLAQDGIETTQAALCTDTGAANHSAQLIMGDVGGTVTSLSPSATYGSSLCAGNYVVEATSTAGKPNLTASAEYGDPTPGQSSCAYAKVSMEAFGFDAASNTWVSLGTKFAAGQWVPSPFGSGGSCQAAAAIPVVGSFSKIRVAARAYYKNPFDKPMPRRVRGTIFAHF
jgi:hypothetical protein